MKFSADIFMDWLDAKAPDWFALVSGVVGGAIGVAALTFLESLVFGLQDLFFYMTPIVVFSSCAAGFSVWKNSSTPNVRYRKIMCLLGGLAVGVAACALQRYVDRNMFHAQTSTTLMIVLCAAGLPGGLLGGWLKERSVQITRSLEGNSST
jgi:hypothetical protein